MATSLSHLTLSTPSPTMLRDSLTFYAALGFKTLSVRRATVNGYADCVVECLLRNFNECPTLCELTLKIVLDENSMKEFNSDQYVKKKKAKEGEIADQPSLFSLSCDRILEITEALKKLSIKHTIVPPNSLTPESQIKATSIKCLDPMLNVIEITNHTLFSTPKSCGNSAKPIIQPTPTPSSSNLRKKKIGMLTSGGDSSGMNAAVRAITRYAIFKDCDPYAIFNGYDGLVKGGDMIKPFGWEDVRGYLSIGGTAIGTARCAAFRERAGRLDAAYNMVKNGIDALIVIGGDGSLTGADMLRGEWKGLIDELIKTGRLEEYECTGLRNNLTIVGLVGSIDNDMSSTDITIGAFTSLHRICESIDSLTSTALSHQRAFVVEVMGRHCGWLALMAGIASGADWVFLPERPPPSLDKEVDWESEMCSRLKEQRAMGSKKTMVIVCEGAIDRHLNPIKSDYIRQVISTRLGLDTRVTTLGHVQRGGVPCAYDRYLATIQGIEAVNAVLKSTADTPSPMIGMRNNKIINIPLVEAVQLTHSVAEAISKKDFKTAMELRDPDFNYSYDSYVESTLMSTSIAQKKDSEKALRVGIIHIGAPAGGMNAAVRIAGRLCLNRGHIPIGIRNGFSGLVADQVHELTWQEMAGWQSKGGCDLGINRDHPEPIDPNDNPTSYDSLIPLGLISYHMQKHNIQSLLIIGGFEAFTALLTLCRARIMYPAFCIPMVTLPATVSNNVPGTEYSLGSDTALNCIVEACDKIKLSANASKSRVFIVEVQGGKCGYLAVLGGISCGATTTYIPEKGINIDLLQRDIRHLLMRYSEEGEHGFRNAGRIILRTETAAADVYNTDVVSNIFKAEGEGVFDSRTAILGHLQQGGIPSPLDRIRATRLAVACVDWIDKSVSECSGNKDCPWMPSVYTDQREHATCIGVKGAEVVFTPVEDVLKEANMKKRTSKVSWWMELDDFIRVLSKY